jgi:hypothetical protein
MNRFKVNEQILSTCCLLLTEAGSTYRTFSKNFVRFQVLTAASNEKAFCGIAPYSVVEVYRRFRGVYCLNHHRPEDENTHTSETSVYFETTRSYIPEGCHHLSLRRPFFCFTCDSFIIIIFIIIPSSTTQVESWLPSGASSILLYLNLFSTTFPFS